MCLCKQKVWMEKSMIGLGRNESLEIIPDN